MRSKRRFIKLTIYRDYRLRDWSLYGYMPSKTADYHKPPIDRRQRHNDHPLKCLYKSVTHGIEEVLLGGVWVEM